MLFANSARLAIVSLVLFVLACASPKYTRDDAGKWIKHHVENQLFQFTAGLCTPTSYQSVLDAADHWVDMLCAKSDMPITFDSNSYGLGQRITNPYVQAALSFGSLRAALESRSYVELQERMVIFTSVATQPGLMFYQRYSEFMPIMLLATGEHTVPSCLSIAVLNLVNYSCEEHKVLLPQIFYTLVVQYVLYGEEDGWEALDVWLGSCASSVITLPLLEKLLAALDTKLLHTPPQPADKPFPIDESSPVYANLIKVIKAVVGRAPRKVKNEAYTIKLYDPLLQNIESEIKAERDAKRKEQEEATANEDRSIELIDNK